MERILILEDSAQCNDHDEIDTLNDSSDDNCPSLKVNDSASSLTEKSIIFSMKNNNAMQANFSQVIFLREF